MLDDGGPALIKQTDWLTGANHALLLAVARASSTVLACMWSFAPGDDPETASSVPLTEDRWDLDCGPETSRSRSRARAHRSRASRCRPLIFTRGRVACSSAARRHNGFGGGYWVESCRCWQLALGVVLHRHVSVGWREGMGRCALRHWSQVLLLAPTLLPRLRPACRFNRHLFNQAGLSHQTPLHLRLQSVCMQRG